MRLRLAALLALFPIGSCGCPIPPPAMPGIYQGSFLVTGALLPTGASVGGVATTCPVQICCPLSDGGQACGATVQGAAGCGVNGDGGALSPSPTLSFYGFLSTEGPVAYWQVENGPLQDGGASGGSFQASVASSAPVPGCNCVAGLVETTFLAQSLADGGVAPSFGVAVPDAVPDAGLGPIPEMTGWLDDRYVPDPTQSPACLPDAGEDSGCVLGNGCDVVYALTAVPGQPGF